MLKNNISISGVIKSDEIENLNCDFTFIKSETSYIFLDKKNHPIDQLLKVSINLDVNTEKDFYIKNKSLLVLKGFKNYNLEFRNNKKHKVNYTNSLPFNICIELDEKDFNEYDVHIIDASYQLLSDKVIYESIVYLVSIYYKSESKTQVIKNDSINDLEYQCKEVKEEAITVPKISNKELLKINTDKNNELLKDVDISEEYL